MRRRRRQRQQPVAELDTPKPTEPVDTRCDWTNCNKLSRWTLPSVSERDPSLTPYLADTQWCDEHYEQVMRT